MVNPFAFDNEITARLALEAEGRRLKYIAVKLWRKYLDDYQPSVYVRTRKSQRAIQLGKVVRLDAFTFGIELTFDNDLTYHDSVMGGMKGHSIMLISEGWRVKSTAKHADVYRFGYFEGINYIGRVIEEFNSKPTKGITLEVKWAGEKYKKKKIQPNVLK